MFVLVKELILLLKTEVFLIQMKCKEKVRVLPHQDFMVYVSCVCCPRPSFTVLFKVLWSAVLAYWSVLLKCGLPYSETKERHGEKETGNEWRGERERLGKRESPGEVNGWNALLRLSEWAARCAGGYCRYCIEAAGVTVAVTDTKTTFHGRRHWLKAVARPLHVDHTLSINNYSFYGEFWMIGNVYFLCYLLDTREEIVLMGRMPPGLAPKDASKTSVLNSENTCCEFSFILG